MKRNICEHNICAMKRLNALWRKIWNFIPPIAVSKDKIIWKGKGLLWQIAFIFASHNSSQTKDRPVFLCIVSDDSLFWLSHPPPTFILPKCQFGCTCMRPTIFLKVASRFTWSAMACIFPVKFKGPKQLHVYRRRGGIKSLVLPSQPATITASVPSWFNHVHSTGKPEEETWARNKVSENWMFLEHWGI